MTMNMTTRATAHVSVSVTTTIFLFLLIAVDSFSPRLSVSSSKKLGAIITALAATNNDDGIAGSFFNAVPSGSGSEKQPSENDSGTLNPKELADDLFERSIAELISRRKNKPLAAEPSTLGGVPTSKVTGFGKSSSSASAPKIVKTTKERSTNSFIGIGKTLNDINNLEYDDQGYTLYADEETGEKKRVFEALVDYPCHFTMKIVGANEGAFAAEMVGVVAESCEVLSEEITYSERRNGKWTSITVQAPVKNAQMLYMLYENIDRDPRVKFKF